MFGVLVEKQLTTPDYYPLSPNAPVAGCNQKTSRDPVINVDEEEAQGALDSLKDKKLVTNTNSWGALQRGKWCLVGNTWGNGGGMGSGLQNCISTLFNL